jgi:hypothetical protein
MDNRRAKPKKLKRSKYFFDLKIDKPLGLAFRRSSFVAKKCRIYYSILERHIYFIDSKRCDVATCFHITSTN